MARWEGEVEAEIYAPSADDVERLLEACKLSHMVRCTVNGTDEDIPYDVGARAVVVVEGCTYLPDLSKPPVILAAELDTMAKLCRAACYPITRRIARRLKKVALALDARLNICNFAEVAYDAVVMNRKHHCLYACPLPDCLMELEKKGRTPCGILVKPVKRRW